MPRSLSLNGPGFLHNSSNCYITSNEIQLLPELHGSMQTELDFSKFYLPDVSIATDHEIQQLNAVTPREIQTLDNIRSKIATAPKTYELDSHLHVHQTTMFQERRTNWFIITSTTLCTNLFLSILFYFDYSRLRNTYCLPTQPNAKSSTFRNSSDTREALELREIRSEEQTQDQRILFASYLLQRTD